ncbi:MAG: peptidase T [Prevotellaceae bacterium]|jgi:tripeptide aminopeptidase|nr:peptidase T [Prevotellaceae bacterium]
MNTLLERFLRYVSHDTQSDPNSPAIPSTQGQLSFLQLLDKELRAMGLTATLHQQQYLCVHISDNNGKDSPAIGFLAHVDITPDVSSANICPQIIKNYDGNDIVLNTPLKIVLRTDDFPQIKQYTGQTLITTDGTTLLGADDKAGVTILMELAQHLALHPEIKHGDIRLAFTTDEEIGRGTDGFDIATFGAKYAYTIDGGAIGELEYENFNAAMATLSVKGCNMHPGEAGKTFKNALLLLEEFNRRLPAEQRPETTTGYQGFLLLSQINGSADAAKAKYLIRDHSRELFQAKKDFLHQIVFELNQQHGNNIFQLQIDDQYYNMRSKIEKHPIVVDKAIEALLKAGINPIIKPIRGGTDGARLSYMGLPCPNLFTGGHNFHSIYEYIPLQSMHKALEVVLNIVESYNE